MTETRTRLIADAYLVSVGEKRLTWGDSRLFDDDGLRQAYLSALRSADRGDYDALSDFAVS
jgi:hypothetical protein